MNEEWRIIPRSKGQYEVSSLGRVRNRYTGRVRKLYVTRSGAKGVSLGGYVRRTVTVGQLVAEAFYGATPRRIKHKNGNAGDDRPENITWEDENEY